jgi:ABC-type Fe3+/spermidine/putrescine transport system ATPase subunit
MREKLVHQAPLEPLGALDRTLRERLMDELPDILHQAGVTVITVTHDQEEAFAVSDRVALMRAGEVVQIGAPQELYRRPGSAWIARFLGLTNLLPAKVVGPQRVQTPIGCLAVESPGEGDWDVDPNAQLLVRPEAARLWPGEAGKLDAAPNRVALEVTDCSFRGMICQLDGQHVSGVELALIFSAGVDLPVVGETITVSLNPEALTLLRESR